MRNLITSLCLVLMPMAVSAHPDHLSAGATSLLHLLDPYHLGLAGMALIATLALRSGRKLAATRR
ncbi:hypothetical protein MK489_21570 [Myxococcota bacterium]|nr:hypothetical protein [Myxococcota bacterium]